MKDSSLLEQEFQNMNKKLKSNRWKILIIHEEQQVTWGVLQTEPLTVTLPSKISSSLVRLDATEMKIKCKIKTLQDILNYYTQQPQR